jgi:hypothetical protein
MPAHLFIRATCVCFPRGRTAPGFRKSDLLPLQHLDGSAPWSLPDGSGSSITRVQVIVRTAEVLASNIAE